MVESPTYGPVSLFVGLALLAACGGEDEAAGDSKPSLPIPTKVMVSYTPGQPCRNGADAPGVFVESSEALGIDFTHVAQLPPGQGNPSGVQDFAGAAIADLDGDSHLDLYLTNAGGPDRLYLTGGRGPGQFESVDRTLEPVGSHGVTVVDVDGDGDRDVVTTTSEDPYILFNDGQADFERVENLNTTYDAREDVYFGSYSVAAGDMNGDRWLDLVVGNHEKFKDEDNVGWPARQWLMINNGEGVFTDRSDWLPVHEYYDWTFVVSLIDFDEDGDLDMYVVNDSWSLALKGLDASDNRLLGSRLYRNDGVAADGRVRITDVSAGSGADLKIAGMGVALGDVDNDGLLDIYVTGAWPDSNGLLRNTGGLVFEDQTEAFGANTINLDDSVGWGTIFFDSDSDGWVDLFVTHGYTPEAPQRWERGRERKVDQANHLLRNLSGKAFEPAVDAGVGGTDWSRCPVVGDLNRDGFPDLVVANVASEPYIYLNGCDERPWLTVILKDILPNMDGIGARVRVSGGGLEQQRHIHAGSDGLYGSAAPEAYFGFPVGTEMVEVTVLWPDGSQTLVEEVPVRHLVTIAREWSDAAGS